MVIEASRCLEEGVVESPFELDMAMLMGLGFPPFRGGLLRYADSQGVGALLKAAARYAKLGPLYQPTKQMAALASRNQGFYPPIE
jgi:3-hydroxyacyl-CoA dehydrogenase/enoyl-CoA hydratase/3-hydroxybutyryl-CoA epimerase/enoyl-CoA isomerase